MAEVVPVNDYKILEKRVGEASKIGPLARPMLRGRGTRWAWKVWIGSSIFGSVAGAAMFYWTNIKFHDQYRNFWWNLDTAARDTRTADNARVWYNKNEYFWRTGRWPGNGYIEVELPEGSRTHEEFKKPIYAMLADHPNIQVDKVAYC